MTDTQKRQPASQLYALLGDQVKSYHLHYHMGNNSSVPTETALELTASIWYTVESCGSFKGDLAALLERGQAVLAGKMDKANQLYRLVSATAPEEQSQCHWEALRSLGRYLGRYDHLHFAHRTPDELYYPLLMPVPEELRGIDHALYYMNCLWMENQILASFPTNSIRKLYAFLPPDYWEAPQNLCEQPLWNGMAKMLLEQPLDSLLLHSGDLPRLSRILGANTKRILEQAAVRLTQELNLPPAPAAYAHAAARELLPRLNAALPGNNLSNLFLTA